MKRATLEPLVTVKRSRARAITLEVTFTRSEKVYRLDETRIARLRRHVCYDCRKPLKVGDYIVTVARGTCGASLRCLSCACRYLQPDVQIIEHLLD